MTPAPSGCDRGTYRVRCVASDGPVSAKLLALALPITGSLALFLGIPLLFAGGDTGPAAACPAGGAAADVDVIAATIRERESGGDYQARADGSTASGAYQFTDATWAGYRGYPHAWQAPPAVQDAKATDHINGILAANDGDASAVPVVWYLGYLPAPDDPAWDTIPSPDAGNRLTPHQYQTAWLDTYATHANTAGTAATAPDPQVSPAATAECDTVTLHAPNDGPGDVSLTTVEGITVNTQIAPQVQQLVQAARHSGYQLTGTGYRSTQRQIELRRQNCGTSHYAIYEMPSSQCTPPTARPGNSKHELGLAIDFSCNGALIRNRATACHQWLADHAATYGLHPLASEPWHWSVDGS
jgi:D-alanyl-D-alanine carboxypeptidase/Transglycosylase-like domain